MGAIPGNEPDPEIPFAVLDESQLKPKNEALCLDTVNGGQS